MHTDWQGFLNTPYEIVTDYQTALEGEARAVERSKKGKPQAASDAPPGFTEETVEEVIEF